VQLTTGITVRGSLEFRGRPNAALFLQLFESHDPTTPWSTATTQVGKDFELALPRSSDAILRIWMNANALCEVPIPAASGPIDLGEIELTKDHFRPFEAR
jgi:hypothetical protein